MTLEQVFFVTQSTAAAAVVASILYLAREVRQSERVRRATMSGEDSYRQHKAGLLDETAWSRYVAGVNFESTRQLPGGFLCGVAGAAQIRDSVSDRALIALGSTTSFESSIPRPIVLGSAGLNFTLGCTH